MSDLSSATRRLLQATYTPIKTTGIDDAPKSLRGMEKRRFVQLIAPTVAELEALIKQTRRRLGRNRDTSKQELMSTIRDALWRNPKRLPLRFAQDVSQFSLSTLAELGADLIDLRQKRALKLDKSLQQITLAYHQDTRVSAPPTAARRKSTGQPSLKKLLDWAARQEAFKSVSNEIADMAHAFGIDDSEPLRFALADEVASRLRLHQSAIEALRLGEREPIGFLHLERLQFEPVNVERGELVYSLPLAPGEEVTISHKEWSNTTEEFQKIVTDYMEAFSERGVAEKSELSQSTSSEKRHTSSLNTSLSASGKIGSVFNIASTVGYNVSNSATKSEKFTLNQTMSVTRKASSRAKKEHKVSFKIAKEYGEEDIEVRRIKNPLDDQAARLDYFQMLRKWKVQLYRYGLRLTYDIVVPEPGRDVLDKVLEIARITNDLGHAFGEEGASDFAAFDLRPQDITPENCFSLAAQYGAAPPIWNKPSTMTVSRYETARQIDQKFEYLTFEVEIPEGYEVDTVERGHEGVYAGTGTDNKELNFIPSSDSAFNHECRKQVGAITVAYRLKDYSSAVVWAHVNVKLKEETFQQWQLQAWELIRDAAQNQYFEKKQALAERLEELQNELGEVDALSLRKREREEIMKGVLRWLGIADFVIARFDLSSGDYLEDTIVPDEDIASVMAHGEIIKFIHHAIEWENMAYILYPYFWASDWKTKKFLKHPDAQHQVFLKAGSARTILPIRPGYEKEFISFMELGELNDTSGSTAYMSIAEELQNFSETSYPMIPTAEEGALDEQAQQTRERGKLVGTWHEFTPLSALDIGFEPSDSGQ